MLLKWAVEGKRRSRLHEAFRGPHIGRSSICTESSVHTPHEPISPPKNSEHDQITVASEPPKVAGIGKSKIKMHCLVPEEQAIILRDEKLLAVSNPNPGQMSVSIPPTPSSMRIKLPTPALTVENMALLSRELEVNPFDLLTFNKRTGSDGSDSEGPSDPVSTPAEIRTLVEPRRMLARNSSSQTTVIPRDKRQYP